MIVGLATESRLVVVVAGRFRFASMSSFIEAFGPFLEVEFVVSDLRLVEDASPMDNRKIFVFVVGLGLDDATCSLVEVDVIPSAVAEVDSGSFFGVPAAAATVAAADFRSPSDFSKSPKDNLRSSFVFRGLRVFDARRASSKLALDVVFL